MIYKKRSKLLIIRKKKLNQLNAKVVTAKQDLRQALKLRQEVFVKEQQRPSSLEQDGKDKNAVHFVVSFKKQVIATCRLLINNNAGKIQRMAVKSKFRKQGLASKLINKVVDFSKDNNLDELTLDAQLQVKDFYLKKGFNVVSDKIFEQAGINHIKMKMKL